MKPGQQFVFGYAPHGLFPLGTFLPRQQHNLFEEGCLCSKISISMRESILIPLDQCVLAAMKVHQVVSRACAPTGEIVSTH